MQSGSARSSGLSFLNAIMEAHKTSDINLIFSLRHGRLRAENTERNAKNAAFVEMALKTVGFFFRWNHQEVNQRFNVLHIFRQEFASLACQRSLKNQLAALVSCVRKTIWFEKSSFCDVTKGNDIIMRLVHSETTRKEARIFAGSYKQRASCNNDLIQFFVIKQGCFPGLEQQSENMKYSK